MEKYAHQFAMHICKHIAVTEDQTEIIKYGMVILFQICVFVGSVFILGLFFGVVPEALLACFIVAFLRKYSGGIHAKTMELCTIIGVIVCILLGMLSQYIAQHMTSFLSVILCGCTYVITLIFIIYRAPVDSIRKPIKTTEKRYRMKKYSIYILVLSIILSSIFYLCGQISWGISCCLGVLWQTLTLLPKSEVKNT